MALFYDRITQFNNRYRLVQNSDGTYTLNKVEGTVYQEGTKLDAINLNLVLNSIIPTGAIMEYAGDTAPSGFLFCRGQAVSRTTYKALFDVIGTTYGSGNNSDTFNLPDLRGKIPIGLNNDDTDFSTLGKTGGSKTHTNTIQEMVPHAHGQRITAVFDDGTINGRVDHNSDSRTMKEFPQGVDTYTVGGGQAYSIMNPYHTTNFIIKYKATNYTDFLESESTQTLLTNLLNANAEAEDNISAVSEANETATTGVTLLNNLTDSINQVKEDMQTQTNAITEANEQNNATVATVTEQSNAIQTLAAENQDKIDKATIATQDQIVSINSSLEHITNKREIEKFQKSSLYIQTWEGFNDALHPSIVYIENGFAGYKYWMSYTPFTPMGGSYIDRAECPAVVCSNDGVQWQSTTLNNLPIDDLTESEIANEDYFSDPCLVYNESESRLEIFYRYTNKDNIDKPFLYRKYTTDGKIWSGREVVHNPDTSPVQLSQYEWVSPQIFIVNGRYKMYYNAKLADGSFQIRYATCSNPANNDWGNITVCQVTKPNNVAMPWHLGMFKDGNNYHLIGNAGNVECFISNDGNNFTYRGVAIKKDEITMREQSGWYQSVPIKVGNKWLIYATYEYKYYYEKKQQFHNNIMLFIGDDLLKTAPYGGGMISDRQVFNNDVLLASNSKKTLSYLTHESADRTQKYGYSMRFYNKMPMWIDARYGWGAVVTTIVKEKAPDVAPYYVGQMWFDTTSGSLYYSIATNSVSDWKKVSNGSDEISAKSIKNNGRLINTSQRIIECDTIIPIGSYYRGVITTIVNSSVENISGGESGQEILILNDVNQDITLKHYANTTDGYLWLKGGTNKTLKWRETIKFMRYGSYWVEI